jgi:hypothetical protein
MLPSVMRSENSSSHACDIARTEAEVVGADIQPRPECYVQTAEVYRSPYDKVA